MQIKQAASSKHHAGELTIKQLRSETEGKKKRVRSIFRERC